MKLHTHTHLRMHTQELFLRSVAYFTHNITHYLKELN